MINRTDNIDLSIENVNRVKRGEKKGEGWVDHKIIETIRYVEEKKTSCQEVHRWTEIPATVSNAYIFIRERRKTTTHLIIFNWSAVTTTAVRLSVHSSNGWAGFRPSVHLFASKWNSQESRHSTYAYTHTHNLCAYRNGVKPLDTLSTQHPLYSNVHREREREDLALVMYLYTQHTQFQWTIEMSLLNSCIDVRARAGA